MTQNLLEAFKELDLLNEEAFDVSAQGIDELKEFNDDNIINDLQVVIDSEAQDEEELKDSYLGKAILQCEVCKSMIYEDPDKVVIDEEAEVANIEDICPYCQSNDGFKVIGQVAEYCEHCDHEDEEHTDTEVDVEEKEVEIESEEIEESINKEFTIEINNEIYADEDGNPYHFESYDEAKKFIEDNDLENAEITRQYGKAKYEESIELESIKTKKGIRKMSSLKEEDKPAAVSIEDAQKWVDYDMKKYGKISERTNKLVKKAGFQIIKDDHGDYEVTAGKFESLNEEVEKVDIETESDRVTMEQDENGKVVVTTEPKEEKEEAAEEMIAPIEPETEDKFTVEDEYEDIEIDEFDEEEFDTLGEKYLRNVYENVKSFKTVSGSVKGNKLKLEGIITFKSGKQGKTNFVFEAKSITKRGKLKFIGENKQFAKGNKTFTLTGRTDGKKLIAESLTYNYRAKNTKDGTSKRLYGTVSR